MFTHPVIVKRRNGRYGNNLWYSYSPKLRRNVYLNSDLEYDHWILVEFDSNVKLFCEQPKHVKEFVDEEWIDTIFDMWILNKDNNEIFIEVKYAKELDKDHNDFSLRSSLQVQKQTKWCEFNNFLYEIHTDTYIYQNKLLLNNYKRILPYIDNRIEKNLIDRKSILNFLQSNSKVTIAQIESHFTTLSKHRVRDAIFNLIYEGLLNANLNTIEVGAKTEVWIFE
ncbi:hypothetical protein [Paenibacillus sp. Soil787]|uniref:hypothetical protein n=1 Tax=Paenibacillus sp. Soil787 TaxID=1736411 RepID=UPI0007021DCC|nr:hypothetical protein [Paenibacillus sp. Soil787]KRF31707.1 hypothetical protein ASG93_05050 [Paenibacillus sp. Soil787]